MLYRLISCRATQCCDCQDRMGGNGSDFQPMFLCFRGEGMGIKRELEFQRQPDDDFRYYIACTAGLFIFLAAIQAILLPR